VAEPPEIATLLDRLGDDQRAAATAPPGPVLCVAPAGSGKTTTLVARIAWLLAHGARAGEITAITFNRRAAEELRSRIGGMAEETGLPGADVRVRTFHALGLEILRAGGAKGSRVAPVDREAVLRRIRPGASAAERRRLDTVISRLKVDIGADPDEVFADPLAGPMALAYVDYARALREAGEIDFDDLVIGAVRLLEHDPSRLAEWRAACSDLLVDEVQDVDRSQLRLALLLAAPANRIFLVGDDDQSIYGWRLADVRRILALNGLLPGLRRVDLEVNHRCPPTVVRRSVRLIACNRERFEKAIRPGTRASGGIVLAPVAGDEVAAAGRILDDWPADGTSRAILARTNRELHPTVLAAVHRSIPFRGAVLPLPVESALVEAFLAELAATDSSQPLLVRIGEVRTRWRVDGPPARTDTGPDAAPADAAPPDAVTDPDDAGAGADAIAEAMLAWGAAVGDAASLERQIRELRTRLSALRREDAALTLATAHSTKGLEFDHVAVVGMSEGRFPSARTIAEAEDPDRALEEERRLAYVAWTRARRSLTLAYDPEAPSVFMAEAFSPAELLLPAGDGA
jgi:DNA helicase-2/ATP-dependent DNA helicase PcrA